MGKSGRASSTGARPKLIGWGTRQSSSRSRPDNRPARPHALKTRSNFPPVPVSSRCPGTRIRPQFQPFPGWSKPSPEVFWVDTFVSEIEHAQNSKEHDLDAGKL